MTATTITIRVTKHGDDVLFSSAGMALIFGMPLDTTEFPPNAFKDGRRRMREAFAHIGDDDMWEAMAYWAAKDHNAAVKFEVDDGVFS